MYTNRRLESLTLPGAELRLAPGWLPADEADALFDRLQRDIPWECHRIRMFGREVDQGSTAVARVGVAVMQ